MNESEIKNLVETILTSMDFTDYAVEVINDDDYIKINIDALPEQSGILIGRHGEGIDSLQLILNLILNNQNESWVRYLVNINDYRESREDAIKRMAEKAADNAISTGKEVVLNYLPSHERRIAHMHLDENQSVHTYSQGDGKFRRLVVSPNIDR